MEKARGCIFTCTELAKEFGVTRRVMLREFQTLMDMDYITSVVANRGRTTNFTDKFKELITPIKLVEFT